MFVIIPLLLFIASSVAIAVLVRQKMPYLKKLTPQAHDLGPTFWHDMMPEVIEGAGKIKVREHVAMALLETEKFLRKVRLVFSKFDGWAHTLIMQVRKAHRQTASQIEAAPTEEAEPVSPSAGFTPVTNVHVRAKPSPEALKAEEQRLIVEIAKDPKNVALYTELGDVYMKLENYADAKESFQAASGLAKDDDTIKRKLELAESKADMSAN